MMSFLSTFPVLLLAVRASVSSAANPTIVDLSRPEFEPSPCLNDSQGADELLAMAQADASIRSFMVLEHGRVVVEYSRDDVDPSVANQVWSTTKSWMNLCTGLLVQDGLLSVDETLGDVFDDQEAMWQDMAANNATDAELRRAVTIRDLLTMNSGMVTAEWNEEEQGERNSRNGGNAGGTSIADAIAQPSLKKGSTFSYLGANNILSYVVPQRTEYASPREYMAAKVFPALGIANDEIDWWQNEQGIEYAYHGMILTTTQMAKLGQLFLQKGKSSSDNQLINENWVAVSTSLQGGNFYYGYLWWVFLGVILEQPELGTIYCSLGLGGQDTCVSTLTDRVVVQQRDMTEDFDLENGPTMDIIKLTVSPDLSFEKRVEVEEHPSLDPVSEVISGSAPARQLWIGVSVFASLLCGYIIL